MSPFVNWGCVAHPLDSVQIGLLAIATEKAIVLMNGTKNKNETILINITYDPFNAILTLPTPRKGHTGMVFIYWKCI